MTYYQINPVLFIILFIIVFYLNGAFFTQRLVAEKQWPERFFINVSLGFGFVILLCFFLALFHIYTMATVTLVLLIIPIFYILT